MTEFEALNHRDWKPVMQNEITALNDNEIWKLTDLPVGEKVAGCMWVYMIKFKANGSVERLKARLVAKGMCYYPGISR